MTLSDLIWAVLKSKQGDKDFALFHCDGVWHAEIGNPPRLVMLGEAPAELTSGERASPEAAAAHLLYRIDPAASELEGAYLKDGELWQRDENDELKLIG